MRFPLVARSTGRRPDVNATPCGSPTSRRLSSLTGADGASAARHWAQCPAQPTSDSTRSTRRWPALAVPHAGNKEQPNVNGGGPCVFLEILEPIDGVIGGKDRRSATPWTTIILSPVADHLVMAQDRRRHEDTPRFGVARVARVNFRRIAIHVEAPPQLRAKSSTLVHRSSSRQRHRRRHEQRCRPPVDHAGCWQACRASCCYWCCRCPLSMESS